MYSWLIQAKVDCRQILGIRQENVIAKISSMLLNDEKMTGCTTFSGMVLVCVEFLIHWGYLRFRRLASRNSCH